MVLVDTSVWIDFFRSVDRTWKGELKKLLISGQVAIIAPLVAELLYGAKGDKERSRILDLSASVEIFSTELSQWIEAGKLGRSLRKQGYTLSIIDCLLAAVAQQQGASLWTLDDDFAPLFRQGLVEQFRLKG